VSNPAKARGSQFERDAARFFSLERAYGAGRPKDVGDLANDPLYAYECKALKQFDLATAVAEANREATNAGKSFGIALIKKPRAGIQDCYVVMDFSTWRELRKKLK
jgi:hypothetical protein